MQLDPRRRPAKRKFFASTAVRVFTVTTLSVVVATLRTDRAGLAQESRLEIVTPADAIATSFALSPDGTRLVYARRDQLWVRRLNSDVAQPLAGTERGTWPFWSPDGKSVGFFTGTELKRVDVDTGAVQRLADATSAGGWGTWNKDGTILFSPSGGPLMRSEATGQGLAAATRLDPPRQIAHWFPEFLPDGRHFIFLSRGQVEHRGVYIGSLESREEHRLLESDSPARFLPPEHLLFRRDGALVAQRLDLRTLRLVGEPSLVTPVVAQVPGDGNTITVSTSASGQIAFRSHVGEQQLAWLDRAGQSIGTLGAPDTAQPALQRLSRDGRMLALVRTVDGNQDVWLMDVQTGSMRKLTSEPVRERFPAWSPDGRQVAFASERTGTYDMFARPIDGSGPETTLLLSPGRKWPEDWAPGFLLYRVGNDITDDDLWALPLTGNRRPVPVVQGPAFDGGGRFSPDGRWVAYQSAESGRNEVYVQPFPGPGSKIQISKDGGRVPEWRRDGRELFFRGAGDEIMVVPISTEGTALKAGVPAPLFTLPRNSTFIESLDGQRFLVSTVTKEPAAITVLMNWTGKTR